MTKLLTKRNLLKGIAIALKVNIISFLAAIIISVGGTYLLAGFWDWDYLIYLCIFYGINISLILLVKKSYEFYLQHKVNCPCTKD